MQSERGYSERKISPPWLLPRVKGTPVAVSGYGFRCALRSSTPIDYPTVCFSPRQVDMSTMSQLQSLDTVGATFIICDVFTPITLNFLRCSTRNCHSSGLIGTSWGLPPLIMVRMIRCPSTSVISEIFRKRISLDLRPV